MRFKHQQSGENLTRESIEAKTNMIKTKASLAKKVDEDSNFTVVKFDNSSRKRLPKTAPPKSGNKSDSDSDFERVFGDGPKRKKSKNSKDEPTYQSVRREVINFGIAGSTGSDKIEQLAISLGARPQKLPGRNYKEILEEKRKQKLEDGKVNKRAIFGTSASLQNKNQKKKTRKDDGLLKRYGKVEKGDKEQIGKFDRKRK